MDKRTFLLTLSALAPAPWVSPALASVPSGRSVVLEFQRVPLAGFQYHRGEGLWGELAVGQHVNLVREPENPYDDAAIRVDWGDQKLGYVPRADNAALSHLMDQGVAALGEIAALQQSANPWERVELQITIVVVFT